MDLIRPACGLKPLTKRFSPYQIAVAQLIFAGSIWGISFTCVRWALADFSSSNLIFWRFAIAFIVGELLQFIFKPETYKNSWSDLKIALWAGIALGLSILLQTHGLHFTTATKSSFITSLYVVMLPLVAGIIFRQRIKSDHIVLGLIAFAGMALLLDLHKAEFTFNFGDLLTLGCALASTFHIIFIGSAANRVKSGFRFNNFQTMWSLIVIMPFLIYEMNTKGILLWPASVQPKSLLGLFILAAFSSILAFYLQIKAQKVLSNTTSSLLCLLEAPYAFIFAAILLDEKLNAVQLRGVLIILASSVASVYIDRPKNRES
ncbi:MAG: DMT family transporter [Bdellovibrio sp.]|nr:DMT family transporter [Bdellovibrio sp.]